MLKKEVVAWSNKYSKNSCSKCGKKNTLQYVQNQKKISLGRLKIINIGPREFNFECSNCLNHRAMNKTEIRESQRLKYYFRRPTKENIIDKSELTKNVKYPVLTIEKRDQIRSENQKEGMISAAFGVVISLIMLNWFTWAIWIALLSILFGFYAAFEDPEMKFRADIEKSKDIHKPKTKSKRTLK